MKIIVAGATGFIGQPLVHELTRSGNEVVVLTRGDSGAGPADTRAIHWDARTASGPWASELRGADAIVNLAGANIGAKRWTESRKRELESSRIEATGAIVSAIDVLEAADRPKVLVNASGIDYYGDRGDEVITEDSTQGAGFLAQLCGRWEAAALDAEPLGVRVALMRTGVVLGKGSMALSRLALPFKLFAGGPLGSGKQWFPWIHLQDCIGLYQLAIENQAARGPINGVAPDVRREKDVASEIGRVLGRPSWAPAPAFALHLVLGELAHLVLDGRRAEPAKALALGYQFAYPRLPEALANALA